MLVTKQWSGEGYRIRERGGRGEDEVYYSGRQSFVHVLDAFPLGHDTVLIPLQTRPTLLGPLRPMDAYIGTPRALAAVAWKLHVLFIALHSSGSDTPDPLKICLTPSRSTGEALAERLFVLPSSQIMWKTRPGNQNLLD